MIHIMALLCFLFDPLKVLIIVAYTHFTRPLDVDGTAFLLLDTAGSSWCYHSNGFRRFLRRWNGSPFQQVHTANELIDSI